MWKAADRALTIVFFITLPFFLYFLATEAFRAQMPDGIFDLCYNHQIDEPKDVEKYNATHSRLLTAITDDLAVAWQLSPPFGNVDTPAPVTAVAADGDDLVVKYAWKNGVLRMRAVDEDGLNVRYQGTWDDDDGHGCAMFELPLPKHWDYLLPSLRAHPHPYVDSIALGMFYNRDDVHAGWPFKITLRKDPPKPQEKS
ncbi:hypothetical protein [Arvimicrobium flavum]|uniref:hypothetical protein n=1 Tax=Arvimicrobium flavum TaxID=3393320 RepID=UPI00237C43E2|nr:hypothetical protein [Mesorhizobium shangrilense]